MKLIGSIICHFKGHLIDLDDNLIKDFVSAEETWLCKCRSCGAYIVHSGIIDLTAELPESEAMRMIAAYEHDAMRAAERKGEDDV